MPDILTQLAQLAALYTQRAALAAAEAAALPAAVRRALAANTARFAPAHAGLARDITLVETQVRAAVLAHGASVKGKELHAVYVAGRATWSDQALQGYAVDHPAVLAFRQVGKPSVTLRKVSDGL